MMDRKLTEIVTRHAAARRAEEAMTAVGLFWLGDFSESDLVGRLRSIFRSEKEALTQSEIDAVKAEASQ